MKIKVNEYYKCTCDKSGAIIKIITITDTHIEFSLPSGQILVRKVDLFYKCWEHLPGYDSSLWKVINEN